MLWSYLYVLVKKKSPVLRHQKCSNSLNNRARIDGRKCSHFLANYRQSLLSLHMTKSYVRTATRSTLKVEANLTQILNFKSNFYTEFEPFFKKKIYANNGGHFLRLSA